MEMENLFLAEIYSKTLSEFLLNSYSFIRKGHTTLWVTLGIILIRIKYVSFSTKNTSFVVFHINK